MAKEAREMFKITAVQVRKIYELLRLRATDVSNSVEYQAYRLEVKRRLNMPFQKEKNMMKKLEKVLAPQVRNIQTLFRVEKLLAFIFHI